MLSSKKDRKEKENMSEFQKWQEKRSGKKREKKLTYKERQNEKKDQGVITED